ncbi:MAG: Yip1 family protein, partial [Candidatus Micrarchaeota archaeon]
MSFWEKWVAVLTKPKETFAAEKANASLKEGAIHLAIGYGIYGLITGILMAFAPSLFPGIPGMAAGVTAIITTPISYTLFGVAATAILTVFMMAIAKLLSGPGGFAQMYYLGALYIAPMAILQVLTFVPTVGSLVMLLIGIYMLYLKTLMIKEVHGFSTGKAVAVWLIPSAILLIAVLAIILLRSAAG